MVFVNISFYKKYKGDFGPLPLWEQKEKTEYTAFLLAVSNSQSSSMVNVFGDGVGGDSVDIQIVKKVIVTKGQYKDYVNEIQQSYELGLTPSTAYEWIWHICYSHSCL